MIKPPKPQKKKPKLPPKIEKIYKRKDSISKKSKNMHTIVTADSPKPKRKAVPTPQRSRRDSVTSTGSRGSKILNFQEEMEKKKKEREERKKKIEEKHRLRKLEEANRVEEQVPLYFFK